MEMYTRWHTHARTFHYIYLGRGDVSICPPPLPAAAHGSQTDCRAARTSPIANRR